LPLCPLDPAVGTLPIDVRGDGVAQLYAPVAGLQDLSSTRLVHVSGLRGRRWLNDGGAVVWLSQSRSAPDFAGVEWTRRSRVATSIRLDHPRRVRTFTARSYEQAYLGLDVQGQTARDVV